MVLCPPPAVDLGLSLGGNAPKPSPPRPGHLGVPSYPGPTVMPPAQVPRPPKLPAGVDDIQLGHWLVKAYRGAVESRYGGRCHVLGKGGLRNYQAFPELVRGGRTLEEYDIAPAAWAAFTIDNWRRTERSTKPPPIKRVFAPGRIEECADWFMEEGGSYSGGRLVYGAAAQDMMKRYTAMQGALLWLRTKDESEVKAVVKRFFPDGLYDRLLVKAKAEAQDDQAVLNKAVENGEWVW